MSDHKYRFQPYDSLYPSLFLNEKARMGSSGLCSFSIEHIGSTAIPGLGGKEIIDILIGVNLSIEFNYVKKNLLGLGYEAKSFFNDNERLYFVGVFSGCD